MRPGLRSVVVDASRAWRNRECEPLKKVEDAFVPERDRERLERVRLGRAEVADSATRDLVID